MLNRIFTVNRIFTGAVGMFSLVGLALTAHSQTPKSYENNASKHGGEITLEVRTGRFYDKSAYSFRIQAQDVATHQNYVDVCFSACGMLHIDMHGGQDNSAVDLGEVDFDSVNKPPKGEWKERSVEPIAGHTYVQKVDYEGKHFFVKYKITDVNSKRLKFYWAPLDPTVKKEAIRTRPNRARAGEMGFCRGSHGAR